MGNIHQRSLQFFFLGAALCVANNAWAERKPVKIMDTSSSGQTIMITAGSRDGLKLKEALLIRRADKKLVAARVIRLFEEKSAVYIVARYSRENPKKSSGIRNYNILYGIPLNVPELPSNMETEIVDDLERNPQDETFLVDEGREHEPEIDDESYTPETTVKPEFPPPDYRKTHSISLGIGLFRNANLSQTLDPSAVNNNATTMYQGYFLRYGYSFRTNYWFAGRKVTALITIEPSLGTYSFMFNDLTLPNGGTKTEIMVVPLAIYLRYNHEFSPVFMVSAYVGYQDNVVSASNNYPNDRLKDLEGGGITFGLGASLVLSKVMDLRLDAGNDGVFFGTAVKF